MKTLIFSLILIGFCTSIFGRLCSKYEPVRKSQVVWRRSSRVTTYRSWFGSIQTQWSPYSYTETQYWSDMQLKYDCCAGYVREGPLCKPICPKGCPDNSYCRDPSICECREGYEWSSNGEGEPTCEPQCLMGCPENSNCTRPEVCECEEGYEMTVKNDSTAICHPLCPDGCPLNGHCTLPYECSCDDGYKLIDELCEPHCEPECGLHSVCLEPDHCICERGYELSVGENKCTPLCSAGCPAYSVCVDAETCECESGYTMNEKSTQCNPICTRPCPENSVCYKPDECLCHEGYRLKQFSDLYRTIECEAVCPANCLPYGKCDPVTGCECYPGYELRMELANTKEPLCQPTCSSGCEHGFCFSPEVCVCHPGYLMGPSNTCLPTCSMGCINGECIEPEICACKEGYRLKANSVNECEPICEPECLNGDCVAPKICLCWQGYQPSTQFDLTNSCQPICDPSCENANCSAPNECSCFDGYKSSLTESHKCLRTDEGISWSWETVPDEGFSSTEFSPSLATDDMEVLEATPGIECFPYCKCWQVVGNSIALGIANCANICVDGADKPCLDLGTCVCNLREIALNCISGGEDLGNEGNITIAYKCAEAFQIFRNTTNERHTKAPVSPNEFPWMLIVVCSLVAISILVFVVGTLIRRTPKARYVVQFDNL